jgi:hypothetical protein
MSYHMLQRCAFAACAIYTLFIAHMMPLMHACTLNHTIHNNRYMGDKGGLQSLDTVCDDLSSELSTYKTSIIIR